MSVALHLFQLFKGNFKTKKNVFDLKQSLVRFWGVSLFGIFILSCLRCFFVTLLPQKTQKLKPSIFWTWNSDTSFQGSYHDSSFIIEGILQNRFWQDWSKKFDHLIKKFFSTWPLFFFLWWRLLINNCHTQ